MLRRQSNIQRLVRQLSNKRSSFDEHNTRLLLDLASEVAESRLAGYSPELTSPRETIEYVKGAYLDCTHQEHFGVLFLNTKYRVLAFEKSFFKGTLDCASVHPREILKKVLELGAASVVICHNHPSGDCEPSAADRAITERIKESLKLIDVRLSDHLIVSGGNYVSFAERGLL